MNSPANETEKKITANVRLSRFVLNRNSKEQERFNISFHPEMDRSFKMFGTCA
jgi:hypothetical protein